MLPQAIKKCTQPEQPAELERRRSSGNLTLSFSDYLQRYGFVGPERKVGHSTPCTLHPLRPYSWRAGVLRTLSGSHGAGSEGRKTA